MRMLVCGSRNWANGELLYHCLDKIAEVLRVDVVIEGEARGADTMARNWAARRAIPVETYPANWHGDGLGAGPIRNRRMLTEGKPDLVVAFPLARSAGTRHMMNIAEQAGVKVLTMPDDLGLIAALGEGVFV